MGRTGTPSKVGMYLSRDATMMEIRKEKEVAFWNGALKEIAGSPGLEITEERKEREVPLPTPYRREIYSQLGINKGNELHLIVEDSESYTSSYTVTSFETAADLAAALERDPAAIISSWKNYTQNNDYLWEILSADMQILRGPARLPKRVILCGFPSARAEAAALWAENQKQCLTNLIPATAAILKWACQEGPLEGFILLISTSTEIATAYFKNGEIQMLSNQRTKDGFTADEISDLNELAEETGSGRDTPVWSWGLEPGSVHHGRLASRYKNLRTITPEDLRNLHPLPMADKEDKVQEKEAWLLDSILE